MVLWGINFTAVKVLYKAVDWRAATLIRWFFMEAFLVILCYSQRLSPWPRRDQALSLFTLGALSMGVYIGLFMKGMEGSSPAEASIIMACAPIFTYLVAMAVRQEKFVKGAMVGAAIAFAGVAIVVLTGDAHLSGKLFYNLLIFVSSFVWACSSVLSRKLVGNANPLQVLTQSLPGALVVLVPLCGLQTLQAHPLEWSGLTWLAMFHVAILSGAVGFLLFYTGVKQVGASHAMMYQYMVPVLATLIGHFALGTQIFPMQLVGAVVVLAGVATAIHFKQLAQKSCG